MRFESGAREINVAGVFASLVWFAYLSVDECRETCAVGQGVGAYFIRLSWRLANTRPMSVVCVCAYVLAG